MIIEWSPEQIKAIEKSALHWGETMVKFDYNLTIFNNSNKWSDGSKIEETSDYCALCQLCKSDTGSIDCAICSYRIFYGKWCGHDVGHYGLWVNNKCKITAFNMWEALRMILDNDINKGE